MKGYSRLCKVRIVINECTAENMTTFESSAWGTNAQAISDIEVDRL
jgi:hypothetical protein